MADARRACFLRELFTQADIYYDIVHYAMLSQKTAAYPAATYHYALLAGDAREKDLFLQYAGRGKFDFRALLYNAQRFFFYDILHPFTDQRLVYYSGMLTATAHIPRHTIVVVDRPAVVGKPEGYLQQIYRLLGQAPYRLDTLRYMTLPGKYGPFTREGVCERVANYGFSNLISANISLLANYGSAGPSALYLRINRAHLQHSCAYNDTNSGIFYIGSACVLYTTCDVYEGSRIVINTLDYDEAATLGGLLSLHNKPAKCGCKYCRYLWDPNIFPDLHKLTIECARAYRENESAEAAISRLCELQLYNIDRFNLVRYIVNLANMVSRGPSQVLMTSVGNLLANDAVHEIASGELATIKTIMLFIIKQSGSPTDMCVDVLLENPTLRRMYSAFFGRIIDYDAFVSQLRDSGTYRYTYLTTTGLLGNIYLHHPVNDRRRVLDRAGRPVEGAVQVAKLYKEAQQLMASNENMREKLSEISPPCIGCVPLSRPPTGPLNLSLRSCYPHPPRLSNRAHRNSYRAPN